MIKLHVGDQLTYLGGVFSVLGMSPMSVNPRRIYLEEVDGGRRIEVDLSEARREALPARPTAAGSVRGPLYTA